MGTCTQATPSRGDSLAESVMTATAPAADRLIDELIPSLVSPRMAMNASPGFTRRESYFQSGYTRITALGEDFRPMQELREIHGILM